MDHTYNVRFKRIALDFWANHSLHIRENFVYAITFKGMLIYIPLYNLISYLNG